MDTQESYSESAFDENDFEPVEKIKKEDRFSIIMVSSIFMGFVVFMPLINKALGDKDPLTFISYITLSFWIFVGELVLIIPVTFMFLRRFADYRIGKKITMITQIEKILIIRGTYSIRISSPHIKSKSIPLGMDVKYAELEPGDEILLRILPVSKRVISIDIID